jgi:hypothetical protein
MLGTPLLLIGSRFSRWSSGSSRMWEEKELGGLSRFRRKVGTLTLGGNGGDQDVYLGIFDAEFLY